MVILTYILVLNLIWLIPHAEHINKSCVLLILQELESEHKEKKSHYDTTSAGLESNRSKLEQVGFSSLYICTFYDMA